MTTIDEKEILEIEKLKQDIALDMKRFDLELKSWKFDATRLTLYGMAVGGALVYGFFKIGG